MNIHRIINNTKSEGPGNRVAIWTQGCSRHCKGCMAKDTWPHINNQKMSIEEILSIVTKNPTIEGVTILGGEPFEQVQELSQLTQGIKDKGLSTIIFTGYTYEQLRDSGNSYIEAILSSIDVIIDGPYIQELRSFSRPMVGSDNQRFIFLTDTYSLADFQTNTIEVRISKGGIVQYNGMGEFDKFM